MDNYRSKFLLFIYCSNGWGKNERKIIYFLILCLKMLLIHQNDETTNTRESIPPRLQKTQNKLIIGFSDYYIYILFSFPWPVPVSDGSFIFFLQTFHPFFSSLLVTLPRGVVPTRKIRDSAPLSFSLARYIHRPKLFVIHD